MWSWHFKSVRIAGCGNSLKGSWIRRPDEKFFRHSSREGEQQRVSIARALAKNPKILLVMMPTGALDYNTGKAILKLLQDTCREKGVTVILITHNSAIAPMADRVIHIKNGKVSKILKNDHPVPVETIEW